MSMFQSKFYLKYEKNWTILCKFKSFGKNSYKYMVHNFCSDGTFLASVQLPINDESLISCTLVNASVCSLHSPHQPQSQFLYHQHQSSPAPPRGDCRHRQWPPIHHRRSSVTKKKKERTQHTHTNHHHQQIIIIIFYIC